MNDEASMIVKEKKRNATSDTTTGSEAARIIPENQIKSVDVLCGRGPVSFNHEGNARYRQIILNSIDLYNDAKNVSQRSRVVNYVTSHILSAGGHFLRKAKGIEKGWIKMTKQECLEKVSQAIRDAYKHVENRQTKMKELVTVTKVIGEDSKVGDSSTKTSDLTAESIPRNVSSSRYAKRPRSLTSRDESTVAFPGLIDLSNDVVNLDEAFEYQRTDLRGTTKSDTFQQYTTTHPAYVLELPKSESQLLVEGKFSKLSQPESKVATSLPLSSVSNNDRNTLIEQDDGRIFNLEQIISRFDVSSRSEAYIAQQNLNTKQRNSESVGESDSDSDFDSFVQTIDDVLGPLQPEDVEFAFRTY